MSTSAAEYERDPSGCSLTNRRICARQRRRAVRNKSTGKCLLVTERCYLTIRQPSQPVACHRGSDQYRFLVRDPLGSCPDLLTEKKWNKDEEARREADEAFSPG